MVYRIPWLSRIVLLLAKRSLPCTSIAAAHTCPTGTVHMAECDTKENLSGHARITPILQVC